MVNDLISRQYKLLEPVKIQFKVWHNGREVTLELEAGDLMTVESKLGNSYCLCGDNIMTVNCEGEIHGREQS